MVRIEYTLAEMFPRILSRRIAKMGLISKTWLPGIWLAEALNIILAEMANGRPLQKCLNYFGMLKRCHWDSNR